MGRDEYRCRCKRKHDDGVLPRNRADLRGNGGRANVLPPKRARRRDHADGRHGEYPQNL